MTQNSNLSDKLSKLTDGESGIIVKVKGHGAFRKRITEMGFVKGKTVKVIKNAPLQDPVEYEIMGYQISLRRSEANLIEVVGIENAHIVGDNKFEGSFSDESVKRTFREQSQTIQVALVGNPNSGKTTLFNHATGLHEHVGNYGGVTVDIKEARIDLNGYTINITDLPGTYSISEFSPEELFVRKHIFDSLPDVIVNVVDASNLERNLYLSTQLIDMNIKVVIALNMYDELEKNGIRFDYQTLGKMIGIPIVPTTASKGKGIDDLFQKVIDIYNDVDPTARHVHVNYGKTIEESIKKVSDKIKANKSLSDTYSPRYLAIKLLENENWTRNQLIASDETAKIIELANSEIVKLEKEFHEKTETIFADAKYGFINGALKETYVPGPEKRNQTSTIIDSFITHRLFGFPIFLFFMWLMFQVTFTVGSYPMEWIDAGVGFIGDFISSIMPDGALRDMLVDGIIGGVGGVVIFLPNILVLFFFISLMEDTGYMSRAAFIMDKLMHKIGLHGKSFIPLLMGFGCNVPAVMATRTLENRKDRLLTMLITPFMSCSARLPVYVLLISAFFPHNQGLILLSIYIIGVLLAVVVALILKKTFFAKQEVPFVMELPPYRMPTLRNTSLHMWNKGVQYINKMGTVILFASILIWALGYYPRNVHFSKDYDQMQIAIQTDSTLIDSTRDAQLTMIMLEKEAERQEKSYIGQMGHLIVPVIEPLGYDWKIGVSIITGLAAKEIVISTMGVLYQADMNADENSANLKTKLQEQKFTSGDHKGKNVFNPVVAYSLMLFVLIYFPCVAVIAAIKKESNWKWAVFTMVYTTVLAWIVAFAAVQIGNLFL